MLTPPDGRPDGNRIGYLKRPERFGVHDPEVLGVLAGLVADAARRSVREIEKSRVLGSAVFFTEEVSDDIAERGRYVAAAIGHFDGSDLVFLDPDNGLEVRSVRKGRRRSSKYVYFEEVEQLYGAGFSILIYQHFPPVPRTALISRIAGELGRRMPGARIACVKSPEVAYFLVAQPKHEAIMQRFVESVPGAVPLWEVLDLNTLPSDVDVPRQEALSSRRKQTTAVGAHDRVGGVERMALNNLECEIRRGDRWELFGIDEALALPGKHKKRCPECGELVRAHSQSINGNRAHFEHLKDDGTCSRAGKFHKKRRAD